MKPYFISEITDLALKEKGIDKESIIDLTDKMDKNGKLNWDAPMVNGSLCDL